MNPTALKAAAKVGYPRDHIVGEWWSGAEEDTIPAGDAAKGYFAAGFNVAGANFPVIQDIKKYVYAKGKGEMEDTSRIGSIYYNRGVVHGIVTVEAIRTAQAKYGKGKPITPGCLRLDPARSRARAFDDRAVGGRLREGKEHHSARLRRGLKLFH